jgi:hypothetical protein
LLSALILAFSVTNDIGVKKIFIFIFLYNHPW